MPIDDLPGTMIAPGRDKSRDDALRDYRLRLPDADTSTTGQPFVDASTLADALVPLYANAVNLGNYAAGKNKTGAALIEEARRFGTHLLPAAGAIGFVEVDASVGGGTIQAGDEIKNPVTGLRYQCIATALYQDGALVPISGIDTGPETDVDAGTVLQWSAPRPGIGLQATVTTNFDGSGLGGGRDQETFAELDIRLVYLRSNPQAAGNDAQIQAAILATPGQQIGAAFTFPCIVGPGSTAFAFTLKGSGAGRIPSTALIALVHAWLIGQFPADDSFLAPVMQQHQIDIAFQVDWAERADGWTDATPWPSYIEGSGNDVPDIQSQAGPTHFSINAFAGDIPQVGQTIGMYDAANQIFRRKRILTATYTGGTVWAIVCDTSNNASDVSYTPIPGQYVCPWSDSLDSLVPAITPYLDAMGPSEMIAPIPDPGQRQRRSPTNATSAPNILSRKVLTAVDNVATVDDADVYYPALPFVTPVGAPATLVNLLVLRSFGAYP